MSGRCSRGFNKGIHFWKEGREGEREGEREERERDGKERKACEREGEK